MLEKFISIILAVILNPHKYFSQDMPKGESLKEPLIFAAVVMSVSAIVNALIFLSALPFAIKENYFSLTLISAIMFCVLAPVFSIICLYIYAFFTHIAVFVFFPKRTGFNQTLKVLAYSGATGVLAVIPFLGTVIAFVFHIRAVVFGLSAVHNVSALKVFMLFVIIPIIIMSLFLFLFMAFLPLSMFTSYL